MSAESYVARLRGPPFRPALPPPPRRVRDGRYVDDGTLVTPVPLVCTPDTQMELTVRTMARGITLECTAATTALELYQMIERTIGIPIDAQRLIYAGVQLRPGNALIFVDYGIPPGGTVHLVERLRGD